jgi:uncharacterized membrane protein
MSEMTIDLPLDVAAPSLMLGALALTIGALALLLALIVVIESAVLQGMGWGSFKACLRASFWMNLASTLFGFLGLGIAPSLGVWGMFAAWALSIVIEALVLGRLNRQAGRRSWGMAFVANLVSYALILFPIYLFSRSA